MTRPCRSPFQMDGTTETYFMRYPGAGDIQSPPATEPLPTKEQLLELCDSVRTSLRHSKSLGPHADRIQSLLERALKDELNHTQSLDFETLQYARLDKLLGDVLDPAHRPLPLPLRFRADMALSESLQKMWRARFRDQYFSLDQVRQRSLSIGGEMRDIHFTASGMDPLESWAVSNTCRDPISELEGNQQFEPGHWWLNLACAHRDGVIGTAVEKPTKGKYGVTALPLLTGREEHIRGNLYRYIREGRLSDMHVSLLTQVGTQIRILRGYRLKSTLAPQAGVRYDGLYTIRQYGNKLDPATDKYRLELLLERVDGQKSLDEVQQVPLPSQLDDWHAFKKVEAEMVRQRKGDDGLLDFKMRKEEERIDREHWRRASEFKASLGQEGCGLGLIMSV
ncbi:PUA-like domain-containing protein [Colletotrichum phormii]|uniref:PUA-like domain-containing protein n=1 Tax=Colletotrichum phormii TaxID=359342 RepID=A0AAI9ZMY9_9PEZI|nr:PUA-like domain-containing protein [Colletotrichum phormii]KAK1633617.1 PUA-like domain-containing protein [Colletotrichum phormii]